MQRNSIFRISLALGLALILCAAPLSAAQAVPQVSLQAQIDAASSGATINIGVMTYHETLLVTKDIILQGVSTASSVLMPAGAGQRVIKVTGGVTLMLKNLRVTGGAPTAAGDDSGGGIFVENSSLVLDGCHDRQ